MFRLYAEQLVKLDFPAGDLAEGVQRVVHTHAKRTIPPVAEILVKIREARADRLRAAEANAAEAQLGSGIRRFGPADLEHLRLSRQLGNVYGLHWCGDRRDYVALDQCTHGTHCNDRYPDSLHLARAKWDWCVSEGVTPIEPREPERPVAGFQRVGDLVTKAQEQIFD